MTSMLSQLNLDAILRDRLGSDRKTIAEFCNRCKIIEFSLFGSVLRDDFRQTGDDPSDIDILVMFSPQNSWNLFDTINMQRELESMFQRSVDFIFKENLENPYRRAEILNTYQIVYAVE